MFTGLNVKLCLVNDLIPGEDSGVALCRDPVPCRDPGPSRPADDTRANGGIEEVWGEMQG